MYKLLLLFAAFLAFGAEKDQWTKVRDLTSGTELRIYKHAAKQPMLAKMDEAKDDSLIVVYKNEQISIAKSDIDRIDYRPQNGKRVTTETKVNPRDPNSTPNTATRPQPANVPGQSTSSSVNFGKPEFETIYRK